MRAMFFLFLLAAVPTLRNVPVPMALASVFFTFFMILIPGVLLACLIFPREHRLSDLLLKGLLLGILLIFCTYFLRIWTATPGISFLALSTYFVCFSPSVRRQCSGFKAQLAASAREDALTWYCIAAVFIIVYFMLLSFHPYRDTGDLALDLHALGYTTQIVALREGFPLRFISVAGYDLVHPNSSIPQMFGIVFSDIFSCSAFFYVIRIHYIIFSLLGMITLVIASAKLVDKKYRAYAVATLSIIFCTQFTYFPQIAAVPIFVALAVIMMSGEDVTMPTCFLIVVGFFLLPGMRLFASIALVSGLCFAFIVYLFFYQQKLFPIKALLAMLAGTAIAYYFFVRLGATVTVSYFENRGIHVPQLFSETRYFVPSLMHFESMLNARIGSFPVLQSIIMSIASILLYPVYLAKEYGIAVLACMYGIAPICIDDKMDKYIFSLSCIPIGAALSVIPMDLNGGSQFYVSLFGIFTAQLCFIALVAKNNLFQKSGRELLPLTPDSLQGKYVWAVKYREALLRAFILLLIFLPAIHFISKGIPTAIRIFSRNYYTQAPHAGMLAERDLLSAFDVIRKNTGKGSMIAVPDFFADAQIEWKNPKDYNDGASWVISAMTERHPYVEHTWGAFPDFEEFFRRVKLLQAVQKTGLLPQELRVANLVLLVRHETLNRIRQHQAIEIIYQNQTWAVARAVM